METLTPVVVTRKPNVDEATRAFMPIAMRRPAVAASRAVAAVVGLILIAYGIVSIVFLHAYLFGPIFIVLGAFFSTMSLFATRNALRRLVVASAKRLSDTHEVMTISSAGIDTRSDNATSHFDWAALSSAQRLPTGLVYQVGGTSYYVSASEFGSVAEFDRAVAIVRVGVGSTFRD